MNHMDLYNRWLSHPLEDPDLKPDLEAIKGNDEEIYERFYRDLAFGTAGLRGVIGAGTNRMNIYTVRRATQGLAEMLKGQNPDPSVAVSYDSRIKSGLFARETARVLAANGVKVWLYPELMPVPALSFATRELHCDAGVMVTASHNPAKYNGYKVYGSDGCQLTEKHADAVLAIINVLDLFDDVKTTDFDAALKNGMIRYIGADVVDKFIAAVLSQQVNPGVCAKAGLKLVYSPLNGSGNKPVRRVLSEIGAADVTVVPEQEHPDGNFPTCPFPNPEIKEALAKGLELSQKCGADLLLATDPDCDRVGIAVKDGADYRLLTGNQVGALLFDYICQNRTAGGTMPENPIAVTTIVSTKLTNAIGKAYGVKVINVLTGFKYIGEQIAIVEAEGHPERFIFGFEESYGYLAGTHVRDKDAVVGSMLIVEMASWYKQKGMSLVDALDALYEKYGLYCESVANFQFEGAQGMKIMDGMMKKLRADKVSKIAGRPVVDTIDYLESTETTAEGVRPVELPKSNVLEYLLDNGCTAIVRPSGTEPKIKLYLSVVGKDMAEIDARAREIGDDVKKLLGV
ncbi:MAG: phospho-sugar mutase [Anaerotruncus rubiinfantis]|jgi:phosphoglucomutase|uniref:phospho-sugar mutase n=1 Tax=Anaerotruncus rubiinfantis TaxID=1720200 RepID=UPI00189B09B8|nr:phospho-sugar mutase [Anaerotruncus rubiinfantis]